MESGRIFSIPIYGYMDNWCYFSQGFFIFYYLLLFALLRERLYVRIDADLVIGATFLATAIIFLAPISAFDQVSEGEPIYFVL